LDDQGRLIDGWGRPLVFTIRPDAITIKSFGKNCFGAVSKAVSGE
jgi:hypothetical protein